MTIESITANLEKVKSYTVWKDEILFLVRHLENVYMDNMEHIPDEDNWKGVKRIKLPAFTVAGKGEEFRCYGMWKGNDGKYSLCLDEDEISPATMTLEQVENEESLRRIVKELLEAVKVADAWPFGVDK